MGVAIQEIISRYGSAITRGFSWEVFPPVSAFSYLSGRNNRIISEFTVAPNNVVYGLKSTIFD